MPPVLKKKQDASHPPPDVKKLCPLRNLDLSSVISRVKKQTTNKK